jgi:peptidoglycan/LPS O-acetylase OafA/YrhL
MTRLVTPLCPASENRKALLLHRRPPKGTGLPGSPSAGEARAVPYPGPAQGGLGYMPALDGVRALAVLGVMAYHGGIPWLGGGFLGVDAFFVLSGFLITSLLVEEWHRHRTIALGAFWSRRARRLLPALLLVLVFVAGYAAFVATPGEYPGLRLDALSALFYVANWHFILVGSNYFNQTGLPSPLTHTWSLAIEEQFYLVWPLVVVAVLRLWRHRGRRGLQVLLGVCVVGTAASAGEMAYLFGRGASLTRLYYGTDTHAQCLLAGASLACAFGLVAERRRQRTLPGAEAGAAGSGDAAWVATSGPVRRLLTVLGTLGLAGGGLLWWHLSGDDPLLYRGGFLLAAATTAAVLVSVVAAPAGPVSRLLSLRPLRYLGRISYGMYLWHYPLFIWIDGAHTGLTGYWLFAVEAAATVVMATLSFYLVERPIRRGGLLRSWRSWVAAPAAVAATVVVLIAATVPPALAARPPGVSPAGSPRAQGPTIRVLLLGDSVALTLGMGLYLDEKPYHVVEADHGILGCGITDGREVEVHGQVDRTAWPCNPERAPAGLPEDQRQPWPEQWRGWLRQDRPNVVMILAGRWEVVNRTYHGHWTNILHPAFAAYVRHQLDVAVGLASSGGARVVLLTAPCYQSGLQPDGRPWPEDDPARVEAYNRLVDEVAAEHPGVVSVVNLNAMVCPDGHYQQDIGGVVVRDPSDGVHFTLAGGQLLAARIWPVVERVGRQQLATLARASSPRG